MNSLFKRTFFDQIWFRYLYKDYSSSPMDLLIELNKSQYWNRDQLELNQIQNLKKLIEFAKNSSIFYKELYTNLDSNDIKTLDDIKMFPSISKNIIQENDLLIPSSRSLTFKAVTSGSTGDPLTVYLNDLAMAYRIAGRNRFYSWWGIKPYDRGILIWGEKKEDQNKKNNFLRGVYNNLIKRTYKISIFKLNNETIKYYYELIFKYKPSYLYGYTSALKQFAELIVANNLNGGKLNIKIAIVTSEVLLEEDRNFIEVVLGCRVVNEYGAADAGLYAFECPHGGMHIFEESVYMTTNENDEVLTTEFHNYRMPLINYKIGDRVYFDSEVCNCGRTLRKIKSIDGRLGDVIIKPNGEHLSQYFFYYLMKDLEKDGYSGGIRKYKVIQKGQQFDFYIVKGQLFIPEIETYILQSMLKSIGNEITVKFFYIDELPREKSGKLRFFNKEY